MVESAQNPMYARAEKGPDAGEQEAGGAVHPQQFVGV